MAQLFKRTKKSCLKFFRKLTSSAKSSAAKSEEISVESHSIQTNADKEEIPMRCRYPLNPKPRNNRTKTKIDTRRTKYSSSQATTKSSTNFILSSQYACKLDSYLTNARQSMSPSFLSYDVRSVRSFRLLPEDDMTTLSDDYPIRRCSAEAVFEKVHYRDNIRYFRHTPSNASLVSQPATPKVLVQHKENITESLCNGACSQNRQQSNIYLQFRNNISHPVNLTLTSGVNGNLNNLVISEGRNWLNEPCPVVTWDINGNSIDDDIICLNSNWDDCDNRLNMLRDNKLSKLNSEGSFRSSAKSSSTTLETWVDDEVLDNSFNEAMERRFGI